MLSYQYQEEIHSKMKLTEKNL